MSIASVYCRQMYIEGYNNQSKSRFIKMVENDLRLQHQHPGCFVFSKVMWGTTTMARAIP